MDACDPGIDIRNLKTLIKKNTGGDLNETVGGNSSILIKGNHNEDCNGHRTLKISGSLT